MKIFDVRASVKDWIRVGKLNRVVIPVTLAHRDASFDQRTTFWQHDLCAGIINAHFGCDLGVAIVRVNDMGIVTIRRVRGHDFGMKVCAVATGPK